MSWRFSSIRIWALAKVYPNSNCLFKKKKKKQVQTGVYICFTLHTARFDCLSHKGNAVSVSESLCSCSWTIGGNGVSSRPHHCSSRVLGVLSLVTVQPTAAPVTKQLLPKTLGPSNVNIAAHMQHVPHMVSGAPHSWQPTLSGFCFLTTFLWEFLILNTYGKLCSLIFSNREMHLCIDLLALSYCCVSPCFIIARWPGGG